MGGYRVLPEAEKLIVGLWQELKKEGKDHSAGKVLAAAEAYVGTTNKKNLFLPGLRKTQDIIKEARHKNSTLSLEEKGMQEPWSLSTLDKYPIPPEALPAVLECWRYTINLGDPLTIRQAKWVARLYFIFTDITELTLNSGMYAYEELLSLISGTPMRNFELDNHLVMGYREVQTIKIPEWGNSIVTYSAKPQVFIAEDGGIMEEFLNALPSDIHNNDINYVADYAYYLISLISALPSSVKYFPDIESRMVYLRHLYYLSSVDNWKRFKPEEIRDIVVDLRKWIVETKAEIDEERTRKQSFHYPFKNIRMKDEWEHINRDSLNPADIYKRVGYSNYDQNNWERII